MSVRNIITSMRLMSAFDWREFFESVSLVDETLRSETNFGEMDFSTRDDYRHAIEDLSRGSRHSEVEIAQQRCAPRSASDHDPDGRSNQATGRAMNEKPILAIISSRGARRSSGSSASASP